MALPPRSILLAAKRWLDVLPSAGGVSRARSILTHVARYSDLSPTQYATALSLLRDLRVPLENVPSGRSSTALLAAILEQAGPPWFPDADELVRSPAELPFDIAAVGEALGLSLAEVHQQVMVSWTKVDTAARERIGAAGEAALVALLVENTNGTVEHSSLDSDAFGFDVSFAEGPITAHIEVKSTTRRGRFVAYVSRHECEVMLRDPHWMMLALRLGDSLGLEAVGVVPREWIAANLPRDVGLSASWASCKIDVPPDVIGDVSWLLGSNAARALPPWRPIQAAPPEIQTRAQIGGP